MSSFTEYFLNSPVLLLTIWGGIALLVILIFLREPRTLVLASGSQGRLQISRHALHRLVEACCEQLHGVASARAHVERRRGKFTTTIRLKVRPNAKLDAIQGYLTQEIASIYRDNLGLDQIGPVHIEVIGVVPASADFPAA